MAEIVRQLTTAILEAQRKPDFGGRPRGRRSHRMVMFRARRRRPIPKAKRGRVSAKIRKLRAEGVPQKQAVAMALNMARARRLGPRGGYRRVG